MKITLLCISDSDKHFASAIAEYVKRMGKQLEIINIKPVKHGTRKQIIEKETAQMIKKLQDKRWKDTKKILLSKEGKQLSTEEFASVLKAGTVAVFIIGGPYGLDESALENYIDEKVALGKQTMPHGLVKLVLLEQVYRVSMLQNNRSYHY